VRSSGVGWALGIGRIGSIIGPLVGGMLLAAKWSTSAVFMTAAAAALCAALAALSLSRLAGTGGARQASSIDATLKAATTGGT
jgi:AAHS family 4-hydroxybenzoate transporter-like MFS transporter